jgi:hypothetical protein
MPSWVVPILGVILGAGAGVTILSFFRGVDLWRGRTAKTEARGIAFIERTWREDEWAKRVAIHRLEYYRDDVNPFLRRRIALLEGVIFRALGEDRLPPEVPEPVMRPLPERPPELTKGRDDDRDTADSDAV